MASLCSPGEKVRNLALSKENFIPFSRALESARKPLGFRFYLYKNLGKDRKKQSLAFSSLIGGFGEKCLCRRLKLAKVRWGDYGDPEKGEVTLAHESIPSLLSGENQS